MPAYSVIPGELVRAEQAHSPYSRTYSAWGGSVNDRNSVVRFINRDKGRLTASEALLRATYRGEPPRRLADADQLSTIPLEMELLETKLPLPAYSRARA